MKELIVSAGMIVLACLFSFAALGPEKSLFSAQQASYAAENRRIGNYSVQETRQEAYPVYLAGAEEAGGRQ